MGHTLRFIPNIGWEQHDQLVDSQNDPIQYDGVVSFNDIFTVLPPCLIYHMEDSEHLHHPLHDLVVERIRPF
jgi:hypothetical protein